MSWRSPECVALRAWRRVAAMTGTAVFTLLTSCAPDLTTETSPHPDMEGEWAYEAWEMRVIGRESGATCVITGMRLELGPWRPSGFNGRSTGGSLQCSGDLADASGPLESYAIRRGGAVAHHIAFDLATPEWRHEGTISGDTISGSFVLQQGTWRMQGQFRAVMTRQGPASSISTAVAEAP